MAVQSQLYPERLGLSMFGSGVHDHYTTPCNNNNNINNYTNNYNNYVGSGLMEMEVATGDSNLWSQLIRGSHVQQSLFTQQQEQHEQSGEMARIYRNISREVGADSFSFSASDSSYSSYCFFSMAALSQYLGANVDCSQMREIDCILHLQNEKLRFALEEQRRQELSILIKNLELKVMSLMRQRGEELTRARQRSMELEISIKKAQMESETWQRLAREREAMVIDLNNAITQVKQKLVLVNNTTHNNNNRGQDDAESCCYGNNEHNNHNFCQEQEQERVGWCKSCKYSRRSCVVFLPCKHLCSCNFCEPFLAACPVCKSAKQAGMEVFWWV